MWKLSAPEDLERRLYFGKDRKDENREKIKTLFWKTGSKIRIVESDGNNINNGS